LVFQVSNAEKLFATVNSNALTTRKQLKPPLVLKWSETTVAQVVV
jgi:hypothetical protein